MENTFFLLVNEFLQLIQKGSSCNQSWSCCAMKCQINNNEGYLHNTFCRNHDKVIVLYLTSVMQQCKLEKLKYKLFIFLNCFTSSNSS